MLQLKLTFKLNMNKIGACTKINNTNQISPCSNTKQCFELENALSKITFTSRNEFYHEHKESLCLQLDCQCISHATKMSIKDVKVHLLCKILH